MPNVILRITWSTARSQGLMTQYIYYEVKGCPILRINKDCSFNSDRQSTTACMQPSLMITLYAGIVTVVAQKEIIRPV